VNIYLAREKPSRWVVFIPGVRCGHLDSMAIGLEEQPCKNAKIYI
jgi:hypothetical protein